MIDTSPAAYHFTVAIPWADLEHSTPLADLRALYLRSSRFLPVHTLSLGEGAILMLHPGTAQDLVANMNPTDLGGHYTRTVMDGRTGMDLVRILSEDGLPMPEVSFVPPIDEHTAIIVPGVRLESGQPFLPHRPEALKYLIELKV